MKNLRSKIEFSVLSTGNTCVYEIFLRYVSCIYFKTFLKHLKSKIVEGMYLKSIDFLEFERLDLVEK